jgi:hypothetical protein
MNIKTARELAAALDSVEEKDHWGKPSFRYKGKIFMTLWVEENRAMVKLSPIDQSVFCSVDSAIFFPVPGGWGKHGATFVDLKKVTKPMFKDALMMAYAGVTTKKAKKIIVK